MARAGVSGTRHGPCGLRYRCLCADETHHANLEWESATESVRLKVHASQAQRVERADDLIRFEVSKEERMLQGRSGGAGSGAILAIE